MEFTRPNRPVWLAAAALCAAGALLPSGCEKAPLAARPAGPSYAMIDDPLLARMAAAEMSDTTTTQPADVPAAGRPRVTIGGIHAPSDTPPTDGGSQVGTMDDFITRLAEARKRAFDEPDPLKNLGPADLTGKSDATPAATPPKTPDAATPQPVHTPDDPNAVTLIGPRGQPPADAPPQPGPGPSGSQVTQLQLPPEGAPSVPVPPLPDAAGVERPSGGSSAGGSDAVPNPGNGSAEMPIVQKRSDRPLTGAMLEVAGKRITAADVLTDSVWAELDALALRVTAIEYRDRAIDLITQRLRDEVSSALVLREAERNLNDEARQNVDRTVGEIIRDQIMRIYGGSKEKRSQALRTRGLTEEQARDQQRADLLVRSYLRDKFSPQIYITREEAYKYYQAHLKDFSTAQKVHLFLIQIDPRRFPPGGDNMSAAQAEQARQAARNYIDALLSKIRGGSMTFEQAARQFSHGPYASGGGDWGMIRKGGLASEKLEAAAFGLAPGGVSDVVEEDDGFYLVHITERQAPQVVSFSQAQDTIITRLVQLRRDQMINKYLQELFRNSGLDNESVQRFVEETYRAAPQPRMR
ncbi:MAG: Chaperone SurA [Phycisphaerae bacterium]|nr:Chaperone SurA [Phycisphaerae bacterium]